MHDLFNLWTLLKYGVRFENNAQVEAFIFQMAEEVARRLNAIDMRGRAMALKVLKRDPAAPIEGPKVCKFLFDLALVLTMTL